MSTKVHRRLWMSVVLLSFAACLCVCASPQANDGLTALHSAAQPGGAPVCEFLLSHGANVSAQVLRIVPVLRVVDVCSRVPLSPDYFRGYRTPFWSTTRRQGRVLGAYCQRGECWGQGGGERLCGYTSYFRTGVERPRRTREHTSTSSDGGRWHCSSPCGPRRAHFHV